MSETIFLSVVIPVFNEEARIATTLDTLCSYLCRLDFSWEVIVVDDGSADKTAIYAGDFSRQRNLPVRLIGYGGNRGKGYAVRYGIKESRGKFVVFMDADLCCPVEYIDKFISLLSSGSDIVIGSRAVRGAVLAARQPWWREGMGRLFNLLVQVLVLPGIWDTQCGFKAFKGGIAREVFGISSINRFGFDVEIILIARKKGYKITEAPVNWRHSFPSSVRPLKDSFLMLKDLVAVKWRCR